MDQTDQIDFGDLQKGERFKNLARSLKITRLKTNAITPWSSCSSINGDPSFLNYTSTSQISKVGSEILTSSRNLKNLIHKRSNYSPMATSSVRKFSETEENANDKAIMPPPNSSVIRTPFKRSALADSAHERNKFFRQSTHDNDHFSQEKQTHLELNSSKDFSEGFAGPSDLHKEKIVDRHFHRWRVFLNDRGELLIKGSLNNEIWARSKPVVEMLSPTKLKSVYQHTYYLHGNIIDEKNELPKYVYQKFYNGFPDDWRNVHAIWKNYVVLGSKENFRWPMDVNYSDDDLNSEITDITQMQKTEKKFQELSSMEKSTPQRSSGYSSDFPHEKDPKIVEKPVSNKAIKNQLMRNNCIENIEQFSEKENRSLQESRNQFDVTVDRSCAGNLYTALNYALNLKDIIFEDKLTIITQNLLHEKCPKEYVQCVSRTIEYLNNILSFKIGELNESSIKKLVDPLSKDLERKCSTPLSSLSQTIDNTDRVYQVTENNEKITKQNSNEINEKLMRQIISDKIIQGNESEVNERLVNKPSNEIDDKLAKKSINKNENPLNLKNSCEAKQKKCQETDSESEIYAGVPKISEKILQSKIYHKRYRRLDSNGKTRTRNVSKERKNDLLNDSSVSILEDEIHKNLSDDERILRSDSRNLQSKGNLPVPNVDDFIVERRADPLRENRVIDDNKSSSKIPIFSRLPNTMSNENRKSIVNKENMEGNDDIFQRKEKKDYPDVVQRKEMQNLPSNNQKPRIINTENVNYQNFKKPPNHQFSTIEQNQHDAKEMEKQFNKASNPEEKFVENIPKNSNQDFFGSEENPKILKNWIPLVTLVGKKCHLVFEGTLFNAVGQHMRKKFTTSQVLKRISTSIVETADHQFYQLLGEMNIKKHVVPKELLPHCRTGCPANIDQFCAAWLKLKGESNLVERAQKSTEDQKYHPISSRGRSILPPLNFWTDERVLMKDGDPVYKSGDAKEKFVTSIIDSPSESRKSPEQLTTNETVKGVMHSAEGRHAKNKVAQKLKFESSESEEEKDRATNRHRSHLYKLRKRQKISYDDDDDDDENYHNVIQKGPEKAKQLQKVRNPAPMIHLTYKKNAGDGKITLSDDQMSIA